MYFTVTLYAVIIMLIIAVPGYILKKTNIVSDKAMGDFSKVLIYFCQPCLMWYSFNNCRCNGTTLTNIGVGFAVVAVLQLGIIGAFCLIFKKKFGDVRYRVATIGTCFANFAFFGIPILQALFPEEVSNLMVISAIFAVVMNIIGWSLACYIITGDKSYVSIKNILLNPTVIAFVIIIPLFCFNVHIGGEGNGFSAQAGAMLEVLAKMSTVFFMLVLGMRLATVKVKELFIDGIVYFTVFFKQIVFPLIAYGLIYFLPISEIFKKTVFILCCCPMASVVLNYSEMVGEGQDTAASMVLLSTISSVVTLPLMTLFI